MKTELLAIYFLLDYGWTLPEMQEWLGLYGYKPLYHERQKGRTVFTIREDIGYEFNKEEQIKNGIIWLIGYKKTM